MMRKFLLSISLLLICAVTGLQAQYSVMNQPELYVGLAAGPTFSTATMMPLYVDKTFIQGLEGGLVVRYISEKNFGLEAGLNYSQSGWKDDYGYQATDAYQRSISYVELPFLMHAWLPSGSSRFFLDAGPKVGWYLSETESIDNHSGTTWPYYGKTVETYLQWGIMGKVGFEVHFGPLALGLEGGYYYGLSDIFSNKVTDPFVSSNLSQIVARVFLLYRLK